MRSNPFPAEELFRQSLEDQLPRGYQKFREAADQFQKSSISLGPLEAGILRMFVRMQSRPRWVEVGTLTGFSALCIATVLPEDGHLWSLEKNPDIAKRAQDLLAEAGLSSKVTVVVGDASTTLEGLRKWGPFDGIFIDGNKAGYLGYLDWAERNLAPEGLIIGDNVFLGGDLFEEQSSDSKWSPATLNKMKEFVARLLNSSRYDSTLLPTPEGMIVARLKSTEGVR